ncbi:MAG: ATPase, T2SS/T4P/T4SS family [Capsulimonadales bacterium]|nr:ATPase, T2SS/T4P/T4SS family [Capsulimonadales bacterium]
MAIARKTLLDVLTEKQFISREQAQQVQEQLRTNPGLDVGQYVVSNGFAAEVDVYKSKAETENLPFIDLTKHKPEPSAINVVPQKVATQYTALPVRKDQQTLYVAMLNPKDINAIDSIRMASRCTTIRPMMAVPADLRAGIEKNYGSLSPVPAVASGPAVPAPPVGQSMIDLNKAITEFGPSMTEDSDKGDIEEASTAPIVRMANAIIVTAIEQGASDIHIEPAQRNVRIRCRVDGVLQQLMAVPKHIQAPLISRYKIMADMNIAERRIPQDGRIPIKHGTKDYDLRVSCLPSLYGEKIVMRILDKSSVLIGLNKLGIYPDVQDVLEELVIQPNGMFIVTGPTGSGKTTTLYSVLNKLNDIEKNIITVEDPIEYQLSGVTQVGINKKAGLNFSNALRSFLRQDPDIIMVGEMRDLETADIAIEAALTGHLVLSTLHTNDAPSATIRLADMGVEPFLVSATVIGILAQRLARKVCSECKEPYDIPAHELAKFGFDPSNKALLKEFGLELTSEEDTITLYRGRGCEICNGKGFKGRTGIHELMRVNAEIAELIVRRAPLADLKAAAKAGGMKEMREDGLRKILDGITTPEEVRRVVFTAGY